MQLISIFTWQSNKYTINGDDEDDDEDDDDEVEEETKDENNEKKKKKKRKTCKFRMKRMMNFLSFSFRSNFSVEFGRMEMCMVRACLLDGSNSRNEFLRHKP